MPFKSYEELINMSKKDPKMARDLVVRAKQAGKPVVSSDNPGYGGEGDSYTKEAVNKRLAATVKSARNQGDTRFKDAVRNRMKQEFSQPSNLQKPKSSMSDMNDSNDSLSSYGKKKKMGYYSEKS